MRFLRIGNHDPQTHIVIEADGPFCADIALSAQPYRLSIDLPDLAGTRPGLAPRGVVSGGAWVGSGAQANASRVLLDLKQPVRVVDTFVVAPGDGKGFRRVVKLEPVGAPDFADAQQRLGQMAAARGCSNAGPATPPTQAAAPAPAQPPTPPQRAALAGQPAAAPASPASAPGSTQAASIQPVSIAPAAAASPVATSPAPANGGAKLAAAPVPAPMPAPGSRLPKDRRWLVMIDPGHGGDDPGAISVGGSHEKDITLAMAKVLKRRMEATKRFRVQLTRSDDTFIELRERTATADKDEVHLFISLHADSIASRNVRGLSVYTLSDKASDAESEALAAKENRADLVVGVDHSRQKAVDTRELLFRMEFDDVSQISRQFRKLVVDEMRDLHIETLPNPHRSAGFVVLKTRKVPSVLVEMGYLSNPTDDRLLRQQRHQERFANAVIKAADRFFACAEVRKWFEKNEEEAVSGRGISCAPSLAMD
ncbi:MAG: N-acetylmuramoyl-L-alanine amidase [Alphaproteobacteria bacterium]|nr:N-acetylmuramoyl-L-alanine amidase [Alphaproteobacteria bacterium]